MKRVKVVHVSPLSGDGGIAYIGNIITNCYKHNIRADYVNIDMSLNNYYRKNKFLRLVGSLKIFYEFISELLSVLFEDNIIVHVHSSSYSSFFEKSALVAMGKALGARTILHLHGGAFDTWYRSMGMCGRSVIRQLLRVPDKVIVLSKRWQSVVSSIIGSNTNTDINILNNCVHVPQSQPKNVQQAPISDNTMRVLFMGRVGQTKGCDELLTVADIMIPQYNIEFFLLGNAAEKHSIADYKNSLCQSTLEYVHFPGYISGDEKTKYLQGSDLFVLPSHVENFPVSILEAMSYGLPIVATDTGAIPDLIGCRNGILIEPGEHNDLLSAIKHMYNNATKRTLMGRRNYEKVCKKYSYEKYCQKLASIYKTLVS